MEDVHRPAHLAAGAGISAGPEPGGLVRGDSAWDDLRSADRVAGPPEAVPCKPDAVQSGAQSCAAPEGQGVEAQLAVFVRELAARQAELR
jgi:hypothetical protein